MADPSTDPVGTVRMTVGLIKVSLVKTTSKRLPWRRLDYAIDLDGISFENLGGFLNEQVTNFPVVGAVPGTPAAATPAPLTEDQRWQWRASMIADLSGMDGVWDDVIGDLPDARSYFEMIADGLLKAGWRFAGVPAAPADDEAAAKAVHYAMCGCDGHASCAHATPGDCRNAVRALAALREEQR